MDIIKLYFNVVSLLGFFTVLIIGIIAYFRRSKETVNKFWFLLCVSASFWSLFFFLIINSPTKELSLLLRIFLDTFVILVVLFWLRFVYAFLGIRRDRLFNYLALLAFGMFLFNIAPGFITDMVPKNSFNYYVEAGFGYYIFLAYFLVLIAYGFIMLFRSIPRVDDIKSNQTKYVILASIIGFLGASSAFLLSFNIYFPPYPFILLPIFPLLILYAITRYQLFDVKVIATELLTFALWLTFFIRTFLSNSFQDILFNGIILFLVVVFGVLLVRSVVREVEQREKIEKAEKEVERALEAEKKANDTLELFMTGLQHDVKGYLTPIIAGSPSLLKGDGVFSNKEKDGIYLNKDGVRTIEIFERSAIAARDQAEDFLAIAKFRTGKPVVSLESDIEISSTLDELVNLFKHEAEQKGIAIKFEKPEKKFFVSADETKLKSALRNVIGNSMKYTREGWVLVDLEEKGNNKILIKVQDTGIGIEPEKISTLFGSPFERTQEAKKTASGAGFGLYFASLIIGLHNGKIWAESKGNDKGSTFYIELPISQKID